MEPLPSTASENKFEFLRQLSMVSRKLKQTCFALYQLYIELKAKSLLTIPSHVLLVIVNKYSKFDSHLLYCEVDSLKHS